MNNSHTVSHKPGSGDISAAGDGDGDAPRAVAAVHIGTSVHEVVKP